MRVLKVMLVAAAAVVMVTAFAKPDRSSEATPPNSIAGHIGQAENSQSRQALVFLQATLLAKSDALVRGIPPFSAMLAGAVLVAPFGYSAYRTLRRKSAA